MAKNGKGKKAKPLVEGSKREQKIDRLAGVREDSPADKRIDKAMGVVPAKKGKR